MTDTAQQPLPHDLSGELWREYEVSGHDFAYCYRIDSPVSLYVGKTTHRVVDSEGIVHCLPAPGHLGCVLRWKPRDPAFPVQF